jgi:carboxymethylenebutenolidase
MILQSVQRLALFLAFSIPICAASLAAGPEKVTVRSGGLRLGGLLWRPEGRGPFPAVLFNHGSGHATGTDAAGRPDQRHPEVLGPVFARHGYVFLYLFRRGDGLSAGQGTPSADLMDRAFRSGGQQARTAMLLHTLQDELGDALAGIAFVRALPEVDAHRVAVIGHSFGGSLALLLAERDSTIRAAVVFSAAGYSWDLSPQLRARLSAAADHMVPVVFFLNARNDHSLGAAETLSARLTRLGKPNRFEVYPPVGRTAEDGHDFVHTGISTWEPDVFTFLDEYTKCSPITPAQRFRFGQR